MTGAGWVSTAVAAVMAMVIGFGAGWFGHSAYLGPTATSAAQEPALEQEEPAQEPVEEDAPEEEFPAEDPAYRQYSEEPAPEEYPGEEHALEDYAEEPPEPGLAATVGLDEVYDAGDGFTVRLTDVERRVAEDGFNAATGEEGALPYLAWNVEVSNETGAPVYTGGTLRRCAVGDPVREGEAPRLGESINPPEQLGDGGAATWEEDCWASEEDRHLQYTVEFHDQDGVIAYGPVTFSGPVE